MKNRDFKEKNNQKKNSFTLIEVLIALIVLAVGVLSIIALSSKSYAAISLQKNKLIANNLAREGIELVNNVRNENWLYRGTSYCGENSSDNTECNGDETPCEGGYIKSKGQVCEDGGNCDWRCFNEKNNDMNTGENYKLDVNLLDIDYSGNPTFRNPRLTDFPNGADNFLKCENFGVELYQNSDGFYRNQGCANCSSSPFRRLIIIDGREASNKIIVEVKVCWRERGGRWQEVVLEKHFYNWFKNEYE